MEIFVKRFGELTTDELFDIYKLRISVFVVEQNCPYQDIDDTDKVSLHVFIKDNKETEAYLRVIPAGTVYNEVSIGRVIAVKRRCGLGTLVLKEGIKAAVEYFNAESIVIGAQTYARGLYEKQGFRQISDEYLEDGIPHIKMKLEIKENIL